MMSCGLQLQSPVFLYVYFFIMTSWPVGRQKGDPIAEWLGRSHMLYFAFQHVW